MALSVVKSEAMPLDPEGTEREARVLGRIGSHDNIVSHYDYDQENDPQYTVFEYLSGEPSSITYERPVPYLGRTFCVLGVKCAVGFRTCTAEV